LFTDLNNQPQADLGRFRGVMRGGLSFDTTGIWDYDLVVTTSRGEVWIVRSNGVGVFISSQQFPQFPEMEKAIIVPNDSVKWGFLAGKVVAGRDPNQFWVFERANPNPSFAPRAWNFPAVGDDGYNIDLENMLIVPSDAGDANGNNFFGVDWGSSRLASWYGSSLIPYRGHMIVFDEDELRPDFTTAMYDLTWDFTQGVPGVGVPVFKAIPPTPTSDKIVQWEGSTFAPVSPPLQNTTDCPFSASLVATVPYTCITARVNNPTGFAASISWDSSSLQPCTQTVPGAPAGPNP